MQKQQDCDGASLNVGPGTDVDDFDDCWAPIRDGMILFGSGGQYIDPAFLFINRKNPPTPANTLPTTQALGTSEVALHVDHLQYKGKTFHLPGHSEEEGYEGGCESTFLSGSRSYHTTLDEEDQEEDSDDLSDCSSILSFDNFGSVMTTPELSFSGLGTPFAMTPEDEINAQLGTPGLSGSATFQGNNNALGFSFEDKQHQDSFSDDRSLGNAQPDDELEEYPGFPLSSLSPFDRRTYTIRLILTRRDKLLTFPSLLRTSVLGIFAVGFPTMADVDEELRRIRVPYDPRIHRKPLPLPLRLMIGALERWAARRTAGLLIPVVDEERGSDARPLDEEE